MRATKTCLTSLCMQVGILRETILPQETKDYITSRELDALYDMLIELEGHVLDTLDLAETVPETRAK